MEKFLSNPNIALVATKYGGHISFVEGMNNKCFLNKTLKINRILSLYSKGLIPTGCNYACRLLNDYLQNVLNDMNQNKSNAGAFYIR